MVEPAISVVIPTRNRCAVLEMTLEALAGQKGVPGRFEVVVVDDGSTDATPRMLRSREWPFSLRPVTQEPGGPARARNRGIGVASGERVLLLGDDTIPISGCLAEHASAGSDTAVQGMIDWDPAVGITEVMRFLAPEGPQFWFKGLETGSTVPWTSIVSSNLSAPTSWFRDEPFDEAFTDACMEDTELAWRWSRRGWRVVFSSRAVCRHRHVYRDIRAVTVRQEAAGRWARLAVRRHPRLFFRLVIQPLAMVPLLLVRCGMRRLLARAGPSCWWDLRCRLAFAAGYVRGAARSRPHHSGARAHG